MMRFLSLLIPFLFIEASHAQPLPALIPYKAKSGWGYCDSNRVMHIPAIYSSAGLFYEGKALVTFSRSDEKAYCVIDEAGHYIIPPAYHWGGPGWWQAQRWALNAHDSSGRLGMIDTAGNILLPFTYDSAPLLRSNEYQFKFRSQPGHPKPFLIVGKGGKQGVIDTLGNEIIPFQYDAIAPSGLTQKLWGDDTLHGWVVKQGAGYGVLQRNGKQLFPPRYDTILPIYWMPWAIVKMKGRTGVVDTAGNVVVPLIYDTVVFNGGYGTTGFQTRLGAFWGWHDAVTGKAVKPAYPRTHYDWYPYGAYGYVIASDTSEKHRYETILLSAGGKLLTRLPYDEVHLLRDSVIVMKYESDRSSGTWKTLAAVLDKKTWKPKGWGAPPKDLIPPEPPIWIPEHRTYTDQPGEFVIYKDGRRIKSFSKDGKDWTVCGYIKTGDDQQLPCRLYIIKFGSSPGWYAVVDSDLHYRISPQTNYEITGGSFRTNKIFVKKNGRYGVTDTTLRAVSRLIKRRFTDYFHWKGRDYFFGVWNAGQPVTDGTQIQNCFRCNCTTLLNSHGKVARNFKPYCNVGVRKIFNARHNLASYDTLTATDSSGREGFISPRGKIYYPKVSFKYVSTYPMHVLSERMILISTRNAGSVLVNANNEPYLPHLHISRVDAAAQYPLFKNGKPKDIPGLFSIYFGVDGTNRKEVYMDRHGTIYAAPDALE